MTELRFDDEATKALVALYVTPDVVAQRAEFLAALEPRTGERVLDIGAGPGFLASAIARETGPSGSVCGIDISEPLLSVAARHCTYPWVQFRQADATQLAFPDCAFD